MNADLYPEPAGETEASGHERLNHRILVVDDEASMREYAVEALAYGGYQSHSVTSGQAAIEALREDHYDMVLTDFNMPNGSGGDLIIKMHAEGFTMPVIMMTGAALTKELLTLTKMLHVGTILQKPFKIDELVTNVERLLQPARNIPVHHEVSASQGLGASESRGML
jgi:DNA-binding NtrC family response regulator